jgi:hypothetical protein
MYMYKGNRHVVVVLALLTFLVPIVLIVPRPLQSALRAALNSQAPSAGDVYSVRALHAELERDPGAWIGRTVRVHAVADYCESWVSLGDGDARNVCTRWQTVLRDPAINAVRTSLPLRFARESKLLATLRRMPFSAALLPPAQVPWWGVPQTYVVRLARLSADACCRTAPSVAAILLDADQVAL